MKTMSRLVCAHRKLDRVIEFDNSVIQMGKHNASFGEEGSRACAKRKKLIWLSHEDKKGNTMHEGIGIFYHLYSTLINIIFSSAVACWGAADADTD